MQSCALAQRKPKNLLLFRHAKSSWDDPALDDFERPLAKWGNKAARLMARWFADQELRPDMVLCSSAARTRETYALVKTALGPDAPVRFEKRLYLAEAEDLLDRIRCLDDALSTVMIIGHNPGLQDLALALAGGATGRSGRRLAEKFPTAAVAWLRSNTACWADLRPGEAGLVAYVRPADLED